MLHEPGGLWGSWYATGTRFHASRNEKDGGKSVSLLSCFNVLLPILMWATIPLLFCFLAGEAGKERVDFWCLDAGDGGEQVASYFLQAGVCQSTDQTGGSPGTNQGGH